MWKPIGLTLVYYEEDDIISYFLAYISLLPIFMAFGTGVLVFFRREIHSVFFLIGILTCELINIILKNIIKEPRPLIAASLIKAGYGMPSDHSQFMFFVTTYGILFLYLRCTLDDNRWKKLGALASIGATVAVCYSRLRLQVHTLPQVLVGCGVGFTFGLAWYFITFSVFAPWWPTIVDLPICQYFYLKDSSHIPNILKHEWMNSIEQRKVHSKTKTT